MTAAAPDSAAASAMIERMLRDPRMRRMMERRMMEEPAAQRGGMGNMSGMRGMGDATGEREGGCAMCTAVHVGMWVGGFLALLLALALIATLLAAAVFLWRRRRPGIPAA